MLNIDQDKFKTRYLIIGLPRSGTTVTHVNIMKHPQVSSLTDELRIVPFFTKGISTFTFGNDSEVEKWKGYLALFDAMTSIKSNDKTTTIGAKCCVSFPFEAKLVVRTLRKNLPIIKIIFLRRKDLIAQYGSNYKAKKSKVYHSWNRGIENLKKNKIRINKLLFTRYVINCLDTMNIIEDLQQSHEVYNCNYEDLIEDPKSFYNKIFSFLGLSPYEERAEAKKLLPPANEYIKNYSELHRLLEEIKKEHAKGNTKKHIITFVNTSNYILRFIENINTFFSRHLYMNNNN